MASAALCKQLSYYFGSDDITYKERWLIHHLNWDILHYSFGPIIVPIFFQSGI